MMDRIETLRLSICNNEGYLIKDPVNRYYYTGFPSSDGTLAVTKEKTCLIIDFRYYEAAVKSIKCGIDVVLLSDEEKQLKEFFGDTDILYVETDYMSVKMFDQYTKRLAPIEVSAGDKLMASIANQRMIKTKSEIIKIRECQRLAKETYNYILKYIGPGKSEIEISRLMDAYMRKNGAIGPSFDTIVLSGENTSSPHGVPGDRTIQKGDLVLMDFGVYMDGYCSDMTRTLGVSYLNEHQISVYNTVKRAQELSMEQIRPGISGSTIDSAAREYIEVTCGYSGTFGHSLGHGVGLEIHEMPNLYPSSTIAMQKGMVVTVEPGIYINGEFGVRIEDFVVVTESGYENLTHISNSLVILER